MVFMRIILTLIACLLCSNSYAADNSALFSEIDAKFENRIYIMSEIGQGMYQFFLQNTDATDDVIDYLINRGYIAKINFLDLDNTRVTNAGLEKLANLMLNREFKSLQAISMRGINGLSRGVKKFVGAMLYTDPHPSKDIFDGLAVSYSSLDDETLNLIRAMNNEFSGGLVFIN